MRRVIRKVPATTNNLTKAIVNFLIDKGHYAFRVNNGAVFDPVRETFRKRGKDDPALSDVMGILKPSGVFIAIEVKNASTKDKANSKQMKFAEEILSRGGFHHFAKTFEGFKVWYYEIVFNSVQ